MDSNGLTPESPAPASPPPETSASKAEPAVEYGPPMPPDYKQIAIVILVLAVLSIPLSCCCVFLGYGVPGVSSAVCALIALIQSGSVSQRYMASDFDGAEKASKTVRKWVLASVIVPFVVAFLMMLAFAAILGVSAAIEHFSKKPGI